MFRHSNYMFIDQEYKSSSELLFHLHDIILRPASSFLRSSSVTPALSLVPNTHTSLPASLWAVYLSLLRYKYKLTRVPPFAPRRDSSSGCDAWRDGVGHWIFERIVALGGAGMPPRVRVFERGRRLTQYELNGSRRGFPPRRYNT